MKFGGREIWVSGVALALVAAQPGKPVGLVHFAAAARDGRHRHEARQFGDIGRVAVRHESVRQALAMLAELAEQQASSPPR